MDGAPKAELSSVDVLTARESGPTRLNEADYSASKEIQEGMAKGRVLVDRLKAGETGESIFESARPRKVKAFTESDRKSIQLQLGGGFATEKSGRIEIDGIDDLSLKAEAEGNLTVAQEALTRISSTVSYNEILQEAIATGKRPHETEAAKKAGITREADWRTHRETVLNTLLDSEALRAIAPDIMKIPDVSKRQELIEAYLAADPRFREAVLRNTNDIQERLRRLPGVEQNKEYSDAEAIVSSSEKTISDAADQIIAEFESKGIKVRGTGYEVHIKAAVDGSGRSIDLVLSQIREGVFTSGSLPNRAEIEKLSSAQDRLRRAEAELALNKKRTGIKPGDEILKADIAERDAARKALEDAQTEYDGMPNIRDQQALYDRVMQLTTLSGSSPEGTSSVTTVGGIAAQAESARSQRDIAKKTVERLKAEVDKRKLINITSRLADEADVVQDLDNALENAICDVLKERHQEFIAAEQARIDEEAKKLEEAGKTQEAADLKTIKESQDKNWVGRDEKSRKETIQYEKIGKDMQFISYKGEEGVKRLMARDLFGPYFDIVNPATGRRENFRYDAVPLDKLSDDQKKRLDAIFESQKLDYVKRLTTDFARARQEAGVFEKGNLKMQRHELVAIDNAFPGLLNEGKMNIETAENEVKKLIDKGLIDKSFGEWFQENKKGVAKGVLISILLGLIAAGAITAGPAALATAKGFA